MIKNIIFDLGGVLIDVDQTKTFSYLNQITKTEIKIEEFLNSILETEILFEKGQILPNDFRNKVRELANVNLSDENIDKAFNSMILGIPDKRLELLKELKKNYKIFVLSNTNAIHFDYFSVQNYWHEEFFDKCYFSHILGMRKPQKEIYEHVIKEQNIKVDETIFIDDRFYNVEAALSLGLKAFHLKEEVCDFFKNKIIK